MTRPQFINGGLYHVYNRGVDKRRVFGDEKDHFRFVHDLFELNDRDAVLNTRIHLHPNYRGETSIVGERRGVRTAPKKRKLLVDILAWVLMPNHYHLVFRQRSENGTSLFMKKLGGGYTLYFNQRHQRNGVLFQGTFKAKHIAKDAYLRHLIGYLHVNPLDLAAPGWRKKGRGFPGGAGAALRFLEAYRWSSCADYLGRKNVPSLLHWDLIRALGLPRGKKHERLLREWSDNPRRFEEEIRAADAVF